MNYLLYSPLLLILSYSLSKRLVAIMIDFRLISHDIKKLFVVDL